MIEDPKAAARRRFVFDPTINLGHVLTAVAMLGAGFGAYSSLDRRLSVQEERTAIGEITRRETDTRTREALGEIKTDLKEVQRSVNDVSRVINSSRVNRP